MFRIFRYYEELDLFRIFRYYEELDLFRPYSDTTRS